VAAVETTAMAISSEPAPASQEDEDAQSAAFDPVTGEINWDCPCLGGMAHGPCGEEFKEAFSCFVYSEQEPKGMECIEKFKGMQDCFRAHPEIYAEGIYFVSICLMTDMG
jgi:intermembrane space import and assembly protein 40